MENVEGIAGYSTVVERFVAVTEGIDFEALHGPYLDLIPTAPSRVLDAGAGVGRDASVFASMGHKVVAIEPMPEFLATARELHDSPSIQWIDDSLPRLEKLSKNSERFDFVLASAVWHHISYAERTVAMSRIAELTNPGGIFALSLRNGPVGGGSHIFSTDYRQTIELATGYGFETKIAVTNQPSLIAGKSNVKWSKLAFKRL